MDHGIHELNLYVRGWLNFYKLSSTYSEAKDLSEWIRRRVRLYYWKQWKQPRTRRRHLLALGADPDTVHMATRSRKGYPTSLKLRRAGWRTCPTVALAKGDESE